MLLRLIFSHLLGAWLLLSFFPRELRAEENEDAPLHLCGRDFIRAMIFICGASRWKRVSMVQEEEPKQLFDSQSSEFMHDRKEGLIPQLNRQDRTEDLIPNMEKFLIGFDEFKEATEKSKNEIKTTTPLKQYDLIWGTHSRKKRDEITGIAYNCCHASCTKKEIARFC
ncbi:prorelaxin H2-like [Sminthopsis crassicaudata]|uniref:prorelaxin H2-like n=1 Tax=Sminthopsis crassicaudata TaxID=9301 RepID=UPI003D68FCD4